MERGRQHPLEVESSGEMSEAGLLLFYELERQAQSPRGVDPQTAALYKALLAQRETSLTPVLIEAADFRIDRQGQTSSGAVGAVRSALATYFSAVEPGFSDADRTTPEAWETPLKRLNDDLASLDGDEIGDFLYNLSFRPVATTLHYRALPPELMLQLVSERFPQGAKHLDVGSSGMITTRWQHRKQPGPLNFSEVYIPHDDNPSDTRIIVTNKANAIVNRPSLLKESVCVDIVPVYHQDRQRYDGGFENWLKGCVRSSERNDAEFMAVLEALLQPDPTDKNITFSLQDLTTARDQALFLEEQPELFDFITANNMIHQIQPTKRYGLLDFLTTRLSPNGLLIIDEFVYLHPANLKKPATFKNVRVYDHWHIPNRHRTLYYDNLNPVKCVQEALSFSDNSRVRKPRVESGTLITNDSAEPIADLIKNS